MQQLEIDLPVSIHYLEIYEYLTEIGNLKPLDAEAFIKRLMPWLLDENYVRKEKVA